MKYKLRITGECKQNMKLCLWAELMKDGDLCFLSLSFNV